MKLRERLRPRLRKMLNARAADLLLIGLVLYFGLALYAALRSSTAMILTGVYVMHPTFADIHAVLAAIRCQALGYDTFAANPCDAFHRPHVYGPLWFRLDGLGAGHWNLTATGIAVILGFLVALRSVLRLRAPSGWREMLVWAAFLASPSVVLGMERANNDLIIFAMLTAGALLLAGRGKRGLWTGYAIVSLGALLKFYPLVLFLLPLLVPLAALHRSAAALAFAVAGGVVTALTWQAMQPALGVIPDPTGAWSIGGHLIFLPFLEKDHARAVSVLLGALVLAGCFLLQAHRRSREDDLVGPTAGGRDDLAFAVGAMVLLFTYAVSAGYAYRWIFVLMVLPALMKRAVGDSTGAASSARIVSAVAIGSALFVMWYMVIDGVAKNAVNLIWGFDEAIFSRRMSAIKDLAAWLFYASLAMELARRFAANAPLLRFLRWPLRARRERSAGAAAKAVRGG